MNQSEILGYIKTVSPITRSDANTYLEIIDMPLLGCEHDDNCCCECFEDQCVECVVCNIRITREDYDVNKLRLCSNHTKRAQ